MRYSNDTKQKRIDRCVRRIKGCDKTIEYMEKRKTRYTKALHGLKKELSQN